LKVKNPREIYKKVADEIGSIIDLFKSDKYIEMDQDALKRSIISLEEIKMKLGLELSSLDENAEWDVFNIAFYGETNAGKSTLIETLRILLEEPTKVSERKSFESKKQEVENVMEKIRSHTRLTEEITKGFSLEINSLIEKLNLIKTEMAQIEGRISSLEVEKTDLENLTILKKKASIINFILHFFGILKEQKTLKILNEAILKESASLEHLDLKCDDVENEIISLNTDMSLETEALKCVEMKLKEEFNQLNNDLLYLSDGSIIGDGQSDYTKDVISYRFSRNNQAFALLDLPGIEGKEDLVINEIDSAVKKAHVVFYITNKAAHPQNGGDTQVGTIQKIKRHLGQHTEVYSIFNKRIKNHQGLRTGLINDDEANSLLELKKAMKEHLGNHYSENIVLTAYPAFLAVGMSSQDKFLKAQENFLENYDDHERLLSETYVDRFANWLVGDIITDCKAKIIKSNYHKVSVRLNDTESSIFEICDSLIDVKKLVEKTRLGTVSQLDEATNTLKTNLHNTVNQEMNSFKKSLREKIYIEIEKDINGKTFKDKYKTLLDQSLAELEENQVKSIQRVFNEYKADIDSIIEKHIRYENELIDSFFKYTFLKNDNLGNLKLDGIVNWKKAMTELVLIIGGLVIGLLTPAGWPAIAFTILGALVSISKNLINIFDKNKKIAYQKSVANKSIDKTSADILDSILKSINESNNDLIDHTEKFKQIIRKPTKNLDSMFTVLDEAREKVGLIKATIIREGGN
jgi:hypothetical protein